MTQMLPVSRALSRRSFLVGVGAAGAVISFGAIEPAWAATGAQPFKANPWISIGDDGIVTIMAPASEMGQGVMTVLPLIMAEEMDADWRKVRAVQSPSDAATFGNPGARGTLTTFGSVSVVGYWDKIRPIGAQVRKVLCWSAAEMLQVPVAELVTEPGWVVHANSKRKISYGDIARRGMLPDPMPQVTKDDLKTKAQFRYLGKDIPRVDVPLKVNGRAQYGIDVQLPGMLYAAVLHPPVQGETAQQIDDGAARAVSGIRQIIKIPRGVGVIGDTVEATMKAKALLKVVWSNTAPARQYSSGAIADEYLKIAADWSQVGAAMVNEGDPAAAMAGAAKVIKADFVAEHLAHVCMEPLNATARVDGDKVEVWAGNQSPSVMQFVAAGIAKTAPANVTVNTTLLGGGTGRRSEGADVAEAVMLAMTMPGTPVKVIWSREDDVTNDTFRPLAAQHCEVGLDKDNNIVAWRQRIVCESLFARTQPQFFQSVGGKDEVAGGGGEFTYKVPSHSVHFVRAPRGIAIGAWRCVSPGYVKFAQEQVLDEVAAAKGVDPVAFRLQLLKHEPRAVQVVETVAKMADWSRPRAAGRALGFAYSDVIGGYTALAAECSLDQATGRIRVHQIWSAVDAGLALQPHNIVAQMESSIVAGLGAALLEQIDIVNGVVQQQNIDRYPVLRMSDIPPMQIKVVSTDNHPSGVDQGLPTVAPAIANAIAQLTGKRIRHLPMSPARVLDMLKA